MKDAKIQARSIASKGRRGDNRLLHVSDDELAALAKSGMLTRNPKTGLPEAFGLSDLGGIVNPLIGLVSGGLGLSQNAKAANPAPTPQQDALTAMGTQDFSAGAQTFQTALDPQNALHDRTAQQVQDQARASSAAHGVAMSPYAAGTENQAMSNFNIDWQNNQLLRMIQALTGMSGATNAAGNVNNAATNAGQLALGNRKFGAQQNQQSMNALLTGLSKLFGMDWSGGGAAGDGAGGMTAEGTAAVGSDLFASGAGMDLGSEAALLLVP